MPLLSTLKRALTFNFLLVACIPVLLLGLLNMKLVADRQLEGIRSRNLIQVRSVAEEVELFLDEVKSDLRHVEQTVTSSGLLPPEKIDQYLAGFIQNSHFFESIFILDHNFRVIHVGALPGMQSYRDDYAGMDFSSHQVFKTGRALESLTWSDTYVSLVTGEPSITLGLSIPHGYLLGNIRLSSLARVLQRYFSYGGVDVAILDSHGVLVAHSAPDLSLRRLNYLDHPSVAEAMQGREANREYLQGGRRLLETATSVRSTGWTVLISLDVDEMLSPINSMQLLLIGFLAAAILLGAVIAIFNARRLMQPLVALGLRASQIADGRYEFVFRPSGFSEIDTLADEIANMSQAIKVREESIISNEQRFRDLVNSIDGIVWEMEYPSFTYVFVSRQAESILGYPVHEWYEKASFWQEKSHAGDYPQARSYCQLMTEKHEDHDFECRMYAADGRVVWIHNVVTVIVEDGVPVRLLGVMLDVTDQKMLVDELSRSEQNYREIFNATSDAIFIHDAETGTILDVNQAVLDMFRCRYEDAVGGDVGHMSEGRGLYTHEASLKKFDEARRTGSASFEWRSRRFDGELFWTDVMLKNATLGGEQRILAAVHDITERKTAEQTIRETSERMTQLIECMPFGCIVWTSDFRVNMWNPAAEAIFGYTAREMVGRGSVGTIAPEWRRADVATIWARLMTGDVRTQGLVTNCTKDGRMISCEWSHTLLRDEEQKIVGVISMVQDVTARKAAEDELAKYREHLEELVRQRTAQLEQAQRELVQKERLAVLGQLTATVSHEIRNPLGTVANALFLLRAHLDGDGHEQLARPLKLAERNVERCDNIISELLDFSRQRNIHREPLDVDAWLDELLVELSIPNGVALRRNLAARVVVPADPERLRRVMVNVVTNAIQALDEKDSEEKSLEVETRVDDGRCVILVRDNGPGMSEEVMARIFEPMFSTKTFGVGLGVPIIKNIMEGHGGGVEYRSEPGMGTSVEMWLPLQKA